MAPKNDYYRINARKILAAFEKRSIEGYYCETKEEAVKKALELMEKGSTVSWGGSMTLEEIGLLDVLRKENYSLLDRSTAKNNEELTEIFHKAFSADYYLMSSNAITMDGELINIDGTGNRAAALIYGPKNVIIIAGMNKVTPDEESAILRARNVAAPINALRLSKKTSCTSVGSCKDCLTPDCICCNIVVTRMSKVPNRIKVILVGEDLGY
ncbi:MAG: hypothetical protein PWP07_2732 [Epulopiscium sp.]|jgi:hypothetical protein|uniref:Lactate utilization protein n=1 Tax=Defluviitalea raffinosedens TaxID=1450156 RepID=A0A7C8HEP1_9FIRM|nr:lactate utilization protein [Defluviitalea raffinosedens]MBZ4668238.1 lactate utilization protein [Defluviitaleaceae bacterium]MDK2789487.1 hypothetical protein [Candidatus Epulonipiscium sp.]KAE9634475.1 lactate utilization protein [Defluviitalea raffinosedens]MBM7684730.1 L-lactate utilization protein LutB [Defluviitalea raffinosedens]HHW66960.1 lactate utilization protein [Candidatus Epulonipiscium sp.]